MLKSEKTLFFNTLLVSFHTMHWERMAMLTKEEFDRLPLSGEYDVVVGGGPAGFSAGFAAALSVRNNVLPRKVNCDELRSVLVSQDCIV